MNMTVASTLSPADEKARLAAELAAPSDKLSRQLGRLCAGAVAVCLLWSAAVPISSGVVASGAIGVENRRKTVQHLDGGIIKELRVHEGSRVKAGDILIRLDDTEARLAVSVLQGQADTLRAEQAARQAELAGVAHVAFPQDLLDRQSDPDVAAIIRAQKAAFDARRSNVVGRKSQLGEQLVQLNKEIAGNRAQSESRSDQIELFESEIKDVEGLFQKGLTTRPRLLALQRAAAQSRGERGSLDSEVAKLKARQSEVEIATMQVERESNSNAADVLRQVQSELVQVIDKLAAAKAALARTEVRAPVSGTVVGLSVTTVGGVIRPGEGLMDIVPQSRHLVVNAKVLPKDADSIHFGQHVKVRFNGGGARYAPVVEGTVQKISADSLTDQRSGVSYFEMAVMVPESELKSFPTHLLRPGLPADLLVRTGSHTTLGYLFDPLSKASFAAMREK